MLSLSTVRSAQSRREPLRRGVRDLRFTWRGRDARAVAAELKARQLRQLLRTLHQLRRAAPEIDFRAVNDRASCTYMKMITPAALLRCVREGLDEVHVDLETAERAQGAVQRMIEIGKPGGGE